MLFFFYYAILIYIYTFTEITQGDSLTVSEEVGLEQLSEDATVTADNISFDSFFSELDEAETDTGTAAQSTILNPPQIVQRESVLVRLAKRIKVFVIFIHFLLYVLINYNCSKTHSLTAN